MEKTTENIRISLTDSIILMLVIIAEIVFCVRGGLNLAVPLLLTWLIIFLYCKIRKLPWDIVEGYALQGVRDGFQSVCIVAAVGCLIGTWILGGTIPTMIYYGLKLINPKHFPSVHINPLLYPVGIHRNFLWFRSIRRTCLHGNWSFHGISSGTGCRCCYLRCSFRR